MVTVPRTLAPFGRRTLTVAERRELGAYVVLAADDEAGPMPRAGQFYMLAAAEKWGGREDERPFLPRAFSVLRARERGAGGVRLEFMLEAVGPGTARLAQLAPGDGLHVTGPLYHLVDLETVLLQKLGPACVAAATAGLRTG